MSFTKNSKQKIGKTSYDKDARKLDAELKKISSNLEKVPYKNSKSCESIKAIQNQGERYLTGTKLTSTAKSKMLILHNTAKKQIEAENDNLLTILSDIFSILARGALMLQLAQHAGTLPLYIGSVSGHPPPLVGAIPLPPDEPISEGDFVAAYNQITLTKYEVRDIDEGAIDPEKPNLLTLSLSHLIALPHYRADPRRDAHALFPVQAIVLALYPQTTCFYKGVVQSSPESPTDDYQIAFEDSTYPTGLSPCLPVPQRYVIQFREISQTNESPTHKTPRGRPKKDSSVSRFIVS